MSGRRSAVAARGWSKGQKGIIGKYRNAGIKDHQYYALLKQITGYDSATAPELDQGHFDHFMASLEAAVEDGIAAGRFAEPAWWSNPYHWRARLDPVSHGKMSTRQRRAITTGWAQLCIALPAANQNEQYLIGIARRAINWQGLRSLDQLTTRQAGLVIDALRQAAEQRNKAVKGGA